MPDDIKLVALIIVAPVILPPDAAAPTVNDVVTLALVAVKVGAVKEVILALAAIKLVPTVNVEVILALVTVKLPLLGLKVNDAVATFGV